MKKYFKNSIWLLIIASFLIFPLFTFGAFVCLPGTSISNCQKLKLNEVYNNSYGTTAETVSSQTISQKVGLIISYALAFLGVIFLVLTVYSGFQWMTAGGNEEKITEAKKRLINAVLGLMIVLSAYSITWFVTNKLISTTGYGVTGSGTGTCNPATCLQECTEAGAYSGCCTGSGDNISCECQVDIEENLNCI